jgi:uncharacterized SAM-dependent methyltransferase
MHLVSTTYQRVTIGDESFHFATGENIHTENSYKYTVEEFQRLVSRAGFVPEKVWTDDEQLFSLHYFRLAE